MWAFGKKVRIPCMLPFEFSSHSPIWNTAGSLGFTPPRRGPVDASGLGVFVTNPISFGSRIPAHGTRMLPFAGGVLLHTGLPNPGLRTVLRQFANQWTRQTLPVVVHLLGESPETVSRMVAQLEEVEGVVGIELGLPPEVEAIELSEWLAAGRGELPLIVQLPVDRVLSLAGQWGDSAPDGISLGPPRGVLQGPGERTFVAGRLYGQSLFPQALYAVRAIKGLGIPVIAGGGVYEPAQAQALLEAGASGIQLDLRLWRAPWPDDTWRRWLERRAGRGINAQG